MAQWFLKALRAYGSNTAIVWNGVELSYAALLEAVDQWSNRLETHGVVGGESVAFRSDYSPAAIALLLALLRNRNIAVPLGSQPCDERLLVAAQVTAEFDFTSDAEGVFSRRLSTGDPHPLAERLRQRGEPGLVLFSSGSTGEPKAILHDFSVVLERHRTPRRPLRSLVFLLLDHIGGINTLLYLLRNGGTAVCAGDRAPKTICRLIEKHGVELLPTSPTFLNMMLISRMHEHYNLSTLRVVTYGTEPMPEATLRRLTEALPEIRAKQTYGLSELGIFPSRSPDSKSSWMQVGGEGVEWKVVDGTLRIRSPFAMLGYLNAPSPFDDEGWFDTGDRVIVDGDRMRVLGRESELINVGGEKVFPAEVENVLLELQNVKDATVFGKANAVTGNIVAAKVTLEAPEASAAFHARMREFCATRLARYKIPAIVIFSEETECSSRFKKVRVRESER